MNDIDTPAEPGAPPPHPLARDLAHRLAGLTQPRLLLLGYGSGRNVPVLLAAGAELEIIEADAQRAAAARRDFGNTDRVRVHHLRYDEVAALDPDCAGALSTHALLHGTVGDIEGALRALRARLVRGAPLYATLGTKSDPRFNTGRRVAPNTFVALDGLEAGVPHTYFDKREARALLGDFVIELLEDNDASATAGGWAHGATQAETMRHLFVRAIRR